MAFRGVATCRRSCRAFRDPLRDPLPARPKRLGAAQRAQIFIAWLLLLLPAVLSCLHLPTTSPCRQYTPHEEGCSFPGRPHNQPVAEAGLHGTPHASRDYHAKNRLRMEGLRSAFLCCHGARMLRKGRAASICSVWRGQHVTPGSVARGGGGGRRLVSDSRLPTAARPSRPTLGSKPNAAYRAYSPLRCQFPKHCKHRACEHRGTRRVRD